MSIKEEIYQECIICDDPLYGEERKVDFRLDPVFPGYYPPDFFYKGYEYVLYRSLDLCPFEADFNVVCNSCRDSWPYSNVGSYVRFSEDNSIYKKIYVCPNCVGYID